MQCFLHIRPLSGSFRRQSLKKKYCFHNGKFSFAFCIFQYRFLNARGGKLIEGKIPFTKIADSKRILLK